MERWLDFTEVFSLPVLSNLPWNAKCKTEQGIRQTFERMWTLLRCAVLYFMRYEEGQHNENGILSAQRYLLEYGALAEQVCAARFPLSPPLPATLYCSPHARMLCRHLKGPGCVR